jgi:hypothetical protein
MIALRRKNLWRIGKSPSPMAQAATCDRVQRMIYCLEQGVAVRLCPAAWLHGRLHPHRAWSRAKYAIISAIIEEVQRNRFDVAERTRRTSRNCSFGHWQKTEGEILILYPRISSSAKLGYCLPNLAGTLKIFCSSVFVRAFFCSSRQV